MNMAYLHLALDREFGKDWQVKVDKDTVEEFRKKFVERQVSLFGKKIYAGAEISDIDFIPGLKVNYCGEQAIVEKVDFKDFRDCDIYLRTESGKEAIITSQDLDTYYYFDDFFTRPNDKLLEDFGFVKVLEDSDEHNETWSYRGDHPAAKLPDFWFLDVYVKKKPEYLDDEETLPEYYISMYCGMEMQGDHHGFQVGMEHLEYFLNNSISHHKPLQKKFENDDVIITDPCYVITEHEGEGFLDTAEEIGIRSTTIYGDWSCTVFDSDKVSIGEFCADSGEVGVFRKEDLLKLNPNLDLARLVADGCATQIKNFTGEVAIEFVPTDNKENYYDRGSVCVVGKGNINFKSIQTGA